MSAECGGRAARFLALDQASIESENAQKPRKPTLNLDPLMQAGEVEARVQLHDERL
jgi:hypothetical protein